MKPISASIQNYATAKTLYKSPDSLKETSAGSFKNARVRLGGVKNDKDDRFLIAIRDKIWYGDNKPKLGFFEKRYFAVLRIKDEHGQECYVKVNKQSLIKRLGLDATLVKNSTDVTNLVTNKLNEPVRLPNSIYIQVQNKNFEELRNLASKRTPARNCKLAMQLPVDQEESPIKKIILLDAAAKKVTLKSKAKSPEVNAVYQLGLYFKENGDLPKAKEYFNKAAFLGHKAAHNELDSLPN